MSTGTTRLQPTELRSLYDAAFDWLELKLSERQADTRFIRLRQLTGFRKESVGWAASGRDRVIRATESMSAPPAWLVALSPDDPTAQIQPGMFVTDWINPSMVGTCIRPDPITKEWAALALVKNLEHLEAEVTGREPKFRPVWQHHAEDVRSYESEILAADLVSDDRFGLAIEESLRTNHLNDGKEVAAFARSHRLSEVLQPLTRVVTPAAPLSKGEEGMRGGLCLMALGFRAVENYVKDAESEFEQKVKFVQKFLPAPPRPG